MLLERRTSRFILMLPVAFRVQPLEHFINAIIKDKYVDNALLSERVRHCKIEQFTTQYNKGLSPEKVYTVIRTFLICNIYYSI